MDKLRGDLLTITSGLERVTTREKIGDRLPKPFSGPIMPSEALPERHLDKVIKPPGIDDRLISFLKPGISRKEILMPPGYRAAMAGARDRLAESAGKSPVLKDAVRLLDRELENLELLNMYRGALLKG